MSLEFEFHLQFPCGSPLTELLDLCQVETSPNVNKNWETSESMHQGYNDIILLMSSQPIRISHQLFPCRYSNSRDIVASSLSFSGPPLENPGELACRLTSCILLGLECQIHVPMCKTIKMWWWIRIIFLIFVFYLTWDGCLSVKWWNTC